MYVPGYFEQSRNLEQVEASAGRPLSLAGTFIDVTDHANLTQRLDAAWTARTTPFVNVETRVGIDAIARGELDDAIARFATVTRAWLDVDARRSAIFAPFQEMNLAETAWGCRPEAFREAFRRFVRIFEEMGVRDRIAWAFAPNGWTHPACGASSEPYFPGHDVVDVVGISAYNFGQRSWNRRQQEPHAVYGPWLGEVRGYAGGLPLLIAQTGTLAVGDDRGRWLREMVAYLDAQPDVLGFIYFNLRSRAQDGAMLDWRVFDHDAASPTFAEPAFAEILGSPYVSHTWPLDLFDAPGPTWAEGRDGLRMCPDDATPRTPC